MGNSEATAALHRSTTVEIEPEESAERWGNTGIDVVSTPALLGRIEQNCDAAMRPNLAPGEMTVGVSVSIAHHAPARVGSTITYRVWAPEYTPRIEFSFEVAADDGTIVCDGRHRRAVIDADRFVRALGRATSGADPVGE